MPVISQRTIFVFYDLLSSHSVLRKIQSLFESEGIYKKEGYRSSLSGDRRSEADEYVKSLDFAKPNDVARFLKVIETFIIRHQNSYLYEDEKWNQFKKLLENDGFKVVNEKIMPITVNDFGKLEEFVDELGIDSVQRDWERALSFTETDPEDAITASRSMFESMCKWILDEMEVPYDDNGNVTQYYKLVSKELNLSPDQHGEQVFKQILSSINTLVQGLAALRNNYGDSHGKGKRNYRPAPRHARLAVNLNAALCTYLVETFQNKKSE